AAFHRADDAGVAAEALALTGAVADAGGAAGVRGLGRAAVAGIGALERRQAGPFAAGVLAPEAGLVAGRITADAFHALGGAALGPIRAHLTQLLERLVGIAGIERDRHVL